MTVYILYQLIKDEGYLPASLGGMTGTDYSDFPNTAFNKYSRRIADYLIIHHGYHLGNLIDHIIWEPRLSDYEEMLFHHILANVVLFVTVYANWTPYGAVCCYMSDISEVVIQVGKITSSTVYDRLSAVVLLILIPVWGHFRVYHWSALTYFVST